MYGPVPPDAVIEPLKISLFDAASLPIPGRPASFASASVSVTSMAADGGTVGNAAVGNGAGIVSWNASVGSSSGGSSASVAFGGKVSTDGLWNSAPDSGGYSAHSRQYALVGRDPELRGKLRAIQVLLGSISKSKFEITPIEFEERLDDGL